MLHNREPSVIRIFVNVKSGYGGCGLNLGLSHFSQLPQLSQKVALASKAVKSDSKTIIPRH
jgi:hypothetical protein